MLEFFGGHEDIRHTRILRFFDNAPVIDIEESFHPVDIYYITGTVNNYIYAAITTTIEVYQSKHVGDILVFLCDQEQIEHNIY